MYNTLYKYGVIFLKKYLKRDSMSRQSGQAMWCLCEYIFRIFAVTFFLSTVSSFTCTHFNEQATGLDA